MFSALPSTTDIKATHVSLVPIGRLVALDHRSGLFVLKKLEFLRANVGMRNGKIKSVRVNFHSLEWPAIREEALRRAKVATATPAP
jgi:hypothetical protein